MTGLAGGFTIAPDGTGPGSFSYTAGAAGAQPWRTYPPPSPNYYAQFNSDPDPQASADADMAAKYGRAQGTTKKFVGTGGGLDTLGGVPTGTAAALQKLQNLDVYAAAGTTVWACINPLVTDDWTSGNTKLQTEKANVTALMAAWKAAGYADNVVVVFYQEPGNKSFLNGGHADRFGTCYATYGPIVRAAGFQLGYAGSHVNTTSHTTNPDFGDFLDAIYTAGGSVDVAGLDYYLNGNGYNNSVDTPANSLANRVFARCDAHGLEVGLSEYGIWNASQADAITYLNFLYTQFSARAAAGHTIPIMCWYAGTPNGYGDVITGSEFFLAPGGSDHGIRDLWDLASAGAQVIGTAAVAGGASTAVATLTGAAPIGDTVIVVSEYGGTTLTSVADSKSNSYTAIPGATDSGGGTHAIGAAQSKLGTALAAADTITATYPSTSWAKEVVAVHVPSTAAADTGACDAATGTGTVPAITSGPLAVTGEQVLVVVATSNAMGTPPVVPGWSLIGQAHQGSAHYLTVYAAKAQTTAPVAFTSTPYGVAGTWSAVIVAVPPSAAPVVTITTTSLPGATVGTAYSQPVAASGTAPYTWTSPGGGLPPGLTLSSAGLITGTPTTAGTYTFDVHVVDSADAAATASLTIVVTAVAAVTITTTSLPPAAVGNAYSQTLAATGGTGPYTWALASGALPTGLSLDPSGGTAGRVHGTPAAGTAADYSPAFQATDSLAATATATIPLRVTAAVTVTTTALPGATVGETYSAALGAAGGTAPYSWAITAGALPDGLALTGNVITGAPTTAGPVPVSFTARVTDASSATATAALSIQVSAPAAAPPAPPDSLILAGQFELLGGGVISDHPMCPGAVFRVSRQAGSLAADMDLSAPQPVTDLTEALALDGEQPIGTRAGNRAATLRLEITAPDRDILAGAREALAQALDAETWELTWTRSGGEPMILDCYRATITPEYSILRDRQLIAGMSVAFPAAPYGRSDVLETITFDSPSQAWPTPPDPVTVDTFTSVSSSAQAAQWSRSSQAAGSDFTAAWSARWSRTWKTAPVYAHTLAAAVDITGLAKVTLWLGLGTSDDQYHVWHSGRVVVDGTLTDGAGNVLDLIPATVHCHASAQVAAPKWNRVSLAIPATTAFDFTHLAGYQLRAWNTTTARGARVLQAEAYLAALTAVPPAVGPGAQLRGSMYSLRGVLGTARAPLAVQVQPGPATFQQTWERSTAGTYTWTPDSTTTTAHLELWGTGASGGGGDPGGSNGGGGGPGAEYAAEPAWPVDSAHPVTVYIPPPGAAGTFPNGAGQPGGDATMTISGTVVLRAHGPTQGGLPGNSTASQGPPGGTGSTATIHSDGGRGGPPAKATGGHPEGSGGGGSGGPFSPGRDGQAATRNGPGSGGVAVTDGGPGGTGGSKEQAGKPPATGPGGGGGGGDDDAAGGTGWAGKARITFGVTAGLPMQVLVLHRPSRRAPHTYQPLVTLGGLAAAPDGTVEYTVAPPALPGVTGTPKARFDGTYAVAVSAAQWDAPASGERTVTATIRQYDTAGSATPHDVAVSRTFTPAADAGPAGNNIVVLGYVHLPCRDLAADQTSALYKVTIHSTGVAGGANDDRFTDLLLLDSEGTTIIVNTLGGAGYANIWHDAPSADRPTGIGRLLGSAAGRESASSILDPQTVISGPALGVGPGDDWLFAWCPAGAPGLIAKYLPRWRLDRLA